MFFSSSFRFINNLVKNLIEATNLHNRRAVFDVHGKLIRVPAQIRWSRVGINRTKKTKSGNSDKNKANDTQVTERETEPTVLLFGLQGITTTFRWRLKVTNRLRKEKKTKWSKKKTSLCFNLSKERLYLKRGPWRSQYTWDLPIF